MRLPVSYYQQTNSNRQGKDLSRVSLQVQDKVIDISFWWQGEDQHRRDIMYNKSTQWSPKWPRRRENPLPWKESLSGYLLIHTCLIMLVFISFQFHILESVPGQRSPPSHFQQQKWQSQVERIFFRRELQTIFRIAVRRPILRYF